MLSITLNPKMSEPENYIDRPTVKAVIFNTTGEVLVFNSNLPGGGVKAGETNEQALHREILEETGVAIEIVDPLGVVTAYRDATQQKYIMYGYLCRYIKKIADPVDEIHNPAFWEKIENSIIRYAEQIAKLKKIGQDNDNQDLYEAKLYNREMSVLFLKEALTKTSKA